MKIEFDPDGWKKATFLGPFKTLTELQKACVVPRKHKAAHAKWQQDMGLENNQRMLAPLDNLHYMARVQQTRDAQLLHAKAGGEPDQVPGLKFSLPTELVQAFKEVAATKNPDDVMTVVAYEGTRETVQHLLEAEFPSRKIKFIPGEENVPHPADIVYVSSFAHYHPGDTDDFALMITNHQSERIVMANTLVSADDAENKWWFQRYFGGGLPVYAENAALLSLAIEDFGYQPSNETVEAIAAGHTYDLNPNAASLPPGLYETTLVFKPS